LSAENLLGIAQIQFRMYSLEMYGSVPYDKEANFMALALRTERTEARLLPEQKKRIEQAASLKGLSISDFIVQHADEAAIKTIESHTAWVLGEKDMEFFVQILLNPPEPSARMKAAVKRYKERGGE
jgi:uncharacterized protein (DUF1778 family)